jgi:acyl-CoA synthetase (AMP-forming)/AMP-acid ligase II
VAEAERQGRTVPTIETVYIGGTVMPPGVADRMRAVAEGCTIHAMYGATETGIATSRIYEGDDPSNAGEVLPGARVEVVDDSDHVVAVGVPGRVRHRTPGMVREYVGDPYATAQAFRDGWFYPGDLGFIRPDGGLTLTGRESEVLNAGGVKIDPNRLDRFALAEAGIEDACAFDYADTSGIRRIGLALVAADDLDVTGFVARLSTEFGTAAPSLVARVELVPRNKMGKPLRRILAERYSES